MKKHNPLAQKKKQKAALALKKGRLDEAARILQKLCKENGGDPEAWVMLASVHGQQSRFAAVAECCRRAIALQSDHPQANSLLGNALAAMGRHTEALDCYRRALAKRPNDPGILHNYGTALYLAGELEEAAEVLGKVARIHPNYPDVHNNLGNIYKALNDNTRAIRHYQRAVQLQPDLFEAHLNLGDIFISRIGHPHAAEHHYREACRIKPGDIEANAGVINVLRFMGRLDEAMEVIRTLEQHHPNEQSIVAGEADLLERRGDKEGAFRLARRLAEQGSSDPMAADVLLRTCTQFDYCDKAIAHAENLLDSGTLKPVGRETLHFGLGKLLDRLGRYDEAFSHYKAGNESLDIPYDPAAFTARVDRLIEAFDPQTLAALPRALLNSETPIFILGMPRSGTSLTEQILASHPEVAGAGELNTVNDLVAGLPRRLGEDYPACIVRLDTTLLDELASAYLRELEQARHNGESRITDKMPHNFLNLGFISLLFPRARIIHCQRNPIDTCLSIYFQNFGWMHPYGTRLDWLGSYYRDYARLMAHWERTLDIPILRIRYEDTVEDQEAVTRKLLDFCGLEWDDACLEFHKARRHVATASYDQVRQKIYKKSKARWKNYQKHLAPLIEALGDLAET